jgi:hypothetical protein
MVLYINNTDDPRTAQRQNAVKGLVNDISEGYQTKEENKALKALGVDVKGIRDPAVRKALLDAHTQKQLQKMKMDSEAAKEAPTRKALEDLGLNPDLPAPILKAQFEQIMADEKFNQISGNQPQQNQQPQPNRQPTQNISNGQAQIPDMGQNPMPQQETNPTVNPIENNQNPPPPISPKSLRDLSDDQLVQLSGVKGYAEMAKQELKRRQEDNKEVRADIRDRNKEVAPLKKTIIERADAARESIRGKEHLNELIDKGDIDDPYYATFLESLPYNLGKRFMSEDTVEYKGGLVDEFKDLKNTFQGATRVKEIEIYENKLADLYLTDNQKKAILKSRINADKIHLLREEAATEVEEKHPNLSALQFNKKVEETLKPKMNALFNNVWDEQKSILDRAESRKDLPLDLNDPEDAEVVRQILKEAKGNYKEAEKIAKKKGYKF